MTKLFPALCVLAAACFVTAASAQGSPLPPLPLRVATWNLGWHMDTALATRWIDACGGRFERDPVDRLWKPQPGGSKRGWDLRWGRGAPIVWDIVVLPPCDVYQANFKIVPATVAAYTKRNAQIARLLERDVRADVLALQEVSGKDAVLEVLPLGGAAYEVCSFTGFKVQRMAIAWRRTLGQFESCTVRPELSLPTRVVEEQPRPGLALTLIVSGKRLRFLTVHLKSSCVSPIEDPRTNGKGQLEGEEPNCKLLQAQLPALEQWIEEQSKGVDALVLLGDMNRNVAQEENAAPSAVVRVPGNPTDPYTPTTRVTNLWREVNDGMPSTSLMSLLPTACDLAPQLAALCAESKMRKLERNEASAISAPSALGCRNPLGLDHIAVTDGLRGATSAKKIALGKLGRSLPGTATQPDPLLALSDHCPLIADLQLP